MAGGTSTPLWAQGCCIKKEESKFLTFDSFNLLLIAFSVRQSSEVNFVNHMTLGTKCPWLSMYQD